MPIYDFRCEACDQVAEHVLLGFDAPVPEVCTSCGKGPLARVWSGARVHISLNGWGFSKTDGLIGGDTRRKDFKQLKERAQRIVDE
jgi:putative FmdB family regulatory protein